MPQSVDKSRFCLVAPRGVYLLSTPVLNSLESSESFILSLSAFLAKVAKIYPQSVVAQNVNQAKEQQSFSSALKEPEHYLQIWCDYLFSLLCSDRIMQVEDECVLIGEVSNDYLNYCLESELFFEVAGAGSQTEIKEVLALEVYKTKWEETGEQEKKRVLIINLSQSVTNVDKTRAKINVDGLFSGIFYRKGDSWKSFRVLVKQIPTVEQLSEADVVLISGSTYSVNQKHPYMATFIDNLMEALQINRELKVAGFCFGHQLIAQAFGSRVEKRSLARGLEVISGSEGLSMSDVAYFSQMGSEEEFKIKIYEFHGDYVVNVPFGFSCLGKSNSCQNQMLVSENRRILTCQFHPQYLLQYIRQMEKRWARESSGFKGIHQEDYQQDREHHETCRLFRRGLRKFIDWKVEP